MENIQLNLDFVWIIMASILVFFMQAGFTALEAGLVRAKNSINVAMKNISDLLVATIVFALFSFGIMFGETNMGLIGSGPFFMNGLESDPWNWAFMLFQIVFAGTAATIVSGAIAERVKFHVYLIGTFFIVLIIYPVFGHWAWGSLWKSNQSGWLEHLGFIDFAGSTVVHSVGGWVALAAAIVVGPRIGKYDEKGNSHQFSPSNTVLAAIGVFILWLGWFGFNAGSTAMGNTDIAMIALNTQLGAVAGGLTAKVFSWLFESRPEVEDILNGILAGLVSVTAGAHILMPLTAIIAGAIGGVIVVVSMRFIENVLKVDDAIGAVAVHGVCGAWGTVALALLAPVDLLSTNSRLDQIGVQLLGVFVAFIWSFALGYFVYKIMGMFTNLRPNKEEEIAGLNVSEHGAKIAMLETITAMNEIASAKGDLTKVIKVELGEDTAEINQAFNQLLKTLNQLIDQVKKETSFVYDSSNHILNLTNKLKSTADHQMGSIKETYDQVIHSRKWLEKEIEIEDQVIATIQDSFAGMEEIGKQVHWIKEEVDHIANFIQHVTDLNKDVSKKVDQFNQKVDKITEFSSESQHVINAITDVSEQINLLSLNAGIEAARSGEDGKGFAVVAQEIKNLANESKQSTSEIQSIIHNTVATITDGHQELKGFTEKIEALNLELKDMPKRFHTMDKKVQQVDEHMEKFVSHLRQVNQETSDMQKNRYTQQQNFQIMSDNIEKFYKQMKQSYNMTKEMAKGMSKMKEQSYTLQQSVRQFKTNM